METGRVVLWGTGVALQSRNSDEESSLLFSRLLCDVHSFLIFTTYSNTT